jgi:hypothetical protein
MVPGQTLLNRLGALLSADTSSIAPAANPPKVHLAMANFTPSPALTLGNLTEATFQGYAAILAQVGAQQLFVDPATGFQTVQLVPPLGGWHFCTTGLTGLPQTIFGWFVSDNGGTVIYGSGLFTTPFNLTASGQCIDIPQLNWKIPPTAMQ